MSRTSRIRIICAIAMVVFGLLSAVFTGYQKEAKTDWYGFLESFGIEKDVQKRYGYLTHEEMVAINAALGARNVEIRDELWDNYRYYDYWLSIFKTLAAAAIFIVIVTYLRTLLDNIPVPEKIYRKFYLPPDLDGADHKRKNLQEALSKTEKRG